MSPLRIFYKQLVDSAQAAYEWQTVRDFCDQCYGKGVVALVDIDMCDYCTRVALIAYDEAGSLVSFDRHLSFFTESPYTGYFSALSEDDDDQAFRVLQLLTRLPEDNGEWVLWQDLPQRTETYALRNSPMNTLIRMFARGEDYV